MLNGTLALHDLQDVEAFCNAALERNLKRGRAHLPPADHEDALAFVVAETWRLSSRYNPRLSPSFAAYARSFQPRFLIEYYRRRWLDTRNEGRYTDDEWARIRQLVYSPDRLDAPVNGHTDDGDPRTLGDLLALPDRSHAADSDTALERADRERRRHRASDLACLRAGLLAQAAA